MREILLLYTCDLKLQRGSALRAARPRRYLDHVMWRGFFLAGGTDAGITRFGAEFVEATGAQIAHAALHAADEIGEYIVDRAADFL